MDESLQELETELTALRPRQLDPALFARVDQEFALNPLIPERPRYSSATNLGSWKWRGWRTAGVAAVVAIAIGLSWERFSLGAVTAGAPTDSPGVERGSYQPVAATNVLYDVQEEGLVKVGEQSARRVRVRYMDTYTWKNPATKASLKWSVPRDEVRVVPVSLN